MTHGSIFTVIPIEKPHVYIDSKREENFKFINAFSNSLFHIFYNSFSFDKDIKQ